jgi:hypothetical protein
MIEFVWLRIDGQVDIWKVIEQKGGSLFVAHSMLDIEKTVKQSDTVGHWVWYTKDGLRTRGFCYKRRGQQTLVRIPICGFGQEVWVSDAIPFTLEESADFAAEMMRRCRR